MGALTSRTEPAADGKHAASDGAAADSPPPSAAARRLLRGGAKANDGASPAATAPLSAPDLATAEQDLAAKLLFFENLFFRMDPNGSGVISTDDIRQVLAFCALDMTGEDIERALFKADSRQRDGMLDRSEFVDLCADVLWRVPVDQLESAASNYAAQVAALEQRINTKWRNIANEIDRYCRFWVPFLYIASLFWLYSVQVDDNYASAGAGDAVQQGNAWESMSISLTPGFPALVITCSIILTICVVGTVVANVMKRRHKARVAQILEANQSSSLKNLHAAAGSARVRTEP